MTVIWGRVMVMYPSHIIPQPANSHLGYLDAVKLLWNCYLIANNSNKMLKMNKRSYTMGTDCKQSHILW